MSALGIQNVLLALARRLRIALASGGLPANVYIGPPDDDTAKSSDITILLIRVVPSQTLRNAERRLPPDSPNAPARVLPAVLRSRTNSRSPARFTSSSWPVALKVELIVKSQ